METVTIKVPTSKDEQLLKSIAKKMGYEVVSKGRKKPKQEVPALVSQDSLAEAWDTEEDKRYYEIFKI